MDIKKMQEAGRERMGGVERQFVPKRAAVISLQEARLEGTSALLGIPYLAESRQGEDIIRHFTTSMSCF